MQKERQQQAQQHLHALNVRLTDAVQNGKSPFHQFTLATLHNQQPEQRMVVLRKWDLKRQSILFHCDKRSPKVQQLQQNPSASLLFYSKEDKVQYRFRVFCHLHEDDRLARFMYEQSTDRQRRCYRSPDTPSSLLKYSKKNQLENAFDNFMVCVCNFTELDLLFLSYQGHERFLYEWQKDGTLKINELAI